VASKSIRDSQKQRLYNAEQRAFEGATYKERENMVHPEFKTVRECQEYVDPCYGKCPVEGSWLRASFPG
jgi:hypothetical protein